MILFVCTINSSERRLIMNKKSISSKILKKAVNASLKSNANSTTCFTIYQPKAPVALKKFSKVDNDQ